MRAAAQPALFTVLATIGGGEQAPTALVDAQPQQASLEQNRWAYFRYVPSTDGDLLFRVTPRFGDPDLFVSNDGARPTAESYGWRSAVGGEGEEQLVVQSTDAKYCGAAKAASAAGCAYLLGVRAFRATDFSISAAAADSSLQLQLGVPTAGDAAASRGRPAYYSVLLQLPSDGETAPAPLELRLAVFSQRVGAALALSSTAPRPSLATGGSTRTTAPAKNGQEVRVALAPADVTALCDEQKQAEGRKVAGLGAGRRCTLYLAVVPEACGDGGTGHVECAAWSLTAATGSGRGEGPTALLYGQPAAGELAAGAWRQYELRADDASALSLALRPRAPAGGGDAGVAELYVALDGPPTTPTAEANRWSLTEPQGGTLLVEPSGAPGAPCADGCALYVGVYARSATAYRLEAASAYSDGALAPGAAATAGAADAGEYAYYKVSRRAAQADDVRVVLEPCGGAPELYASTTVVHPTRDDAEQRPGDYDKDGGTGVQTLRLPAATVAATDTFVGVYAAGGLAASFEIRAVPGGADDGAAGRRGEVRVTAFDASSAELRWGRDSDLESGGVTYEVFYAPANLSASFGTVCGVLGYGTFAESVAADAGATAAEWTVTLLGLDGATDYVATVLARPQSDPNRPFVYATLSLSRGGGGGGLGGGAIAAIVLLPLLALGAAAAAWRFGWLAALRQRLRKRGTSSMAGADGMLSRVRVDPAGGGAGGAGAPLQLEMDANFATSPLSMSAAPLNSGALIPVDGNQAAYVPPALVPSSSEPPASGGGDDGVRATERLE